MPRDPRPRFAALCAIAFLLALGALVATNLLLQQGGLAAGPNLTPPPDDPERGLVYDGLEAASGGPCRGGYRLKGSGLCTHGPDAAPPGVSVPQKTTPDLPPPQARARSLCVGDGTSGNRVQVIYARAATTPDRYGDYLSSIRQWVAAADDIYDYSAAETGGSRRLRLVTDAGCNIAVLNVELTAAGDDNIDNTIAELQAQGHDRADRKYLIFMDASVICGIGTFYPDDRPGQDNPNNGYAASYARVDVPCWNPHGVAHETMHTLGGVQNSAPNASGGYHCVEEYDVMCYSDAPNYPTLRFRCTNPAQEDRFDCNHDDYYHTDPPAGSYLATHWNAADNAFLTVPATQTLALSAGGGGGVAAAPLAASYARGAVVTLTATAEAGYTFTGWRIDGVLADATSPRALAMDTSHTVVAVFAPNAPPHDTFPGQPVGGLPARSTTANQLATTEPGEPTTVCDGQPIARTLWYSYTPAATTNLTVATAGSGFDTLLAVYTGEIGGGLVALPGACNDDVSATDPTSRVTFVAVAGTTYRVQVGGWGDAAGNLVVSFSGAAAPPSPTPAPSAAPGPKSSPLPWTPPVPSSAPGQAESPAPHAAHALTILDAPGGTIAPDTASSYAPGTIVEVQALPAAGYVFTGWRLDGYARGWANPLSLTMDAPHTIAPLFAPRPSFADVGPADPAAEAIDQLAARGVVRGYESSLFGPEDRVVRAQVAALIIRALGWTGTPANPFTDRCAPDDPANCVDPELWAAVGLLAERGVARGYTDPASCGDAASVPCYDPRSPVLSAQVISIITRAMVAQDYWQLRPIDAALGGGRLAGTGHERDVATFQYYTRQVGGIPDLAADGDFPAWDQPATRAWFARALWAVLASYWGSDRPGAGGYVP